MSKGEKFLLLVFLSTVIILFSEMLGIIRCWRIFPHPFSLVAMLKVMIYLIIWTNYKDRRGWLRVSQTIGFRLEKIVKCFTEIKQLVGYCFSIFLQIGDVGSRLLSIKCADVKIKWYKVFVVGKIFVPCSADPFGFNNCWTDILFVIWEKWFCWGCVWYCVFIWHVGWYCAILIDDGRCVAIWFSWWLHSVHHGI